MTKQLSNFIKKNQIIGAIALASFFIFNSSKGQVVSNFENLTLATDTFWDGSDLSGGFASGDAFLKNNYNTSWFSWDGFAYSNKKDSITAGYGNQYAAFAGSGYNGNGNYAVAYCAPNSILKLTGNSLGSVLNGFYVTNNTYAGISMRDGDAFSKKFGGVSGNDPDWFELKIENYRLGVIVDSINVYLADYQFSDNSLDYIIKDWTWVDLTSLGASDSLSFSLSSSDNGMFGMNTPAYFCLDNFTTNFGTGISTIVGNQLKVYPNPVRDIINVDLSKFAGEKIKLSIHDIIGKQLFISELLDENEFILDLNSYENGVYFINIESKKVNLHQKFVKQ